MIPPPVPDSRRPLGPRWRALAALAAVSGGLTAALVCWGTQLPGPGLYGDGAGYLGAAESMARGAGPRVPFASYASADSTSPMAQWPPGFSIVLSGPLRAGLTPRSVVRIVQASVGACTVALTAVTIAAATAPVWGAVAGVALLVTPAVVAVHLNVVSEPLYLLCLAIGLCAMVWRGDRPLGYGLAAAAGILVRYLGIATIAAAGVWAALQPGRAGTRAQRVAVAIAPGILVRELWAAYVRSTGAVLRAPHVDHQIGRAVRALLGATAAWLAPWDGPAVARTALKVALGATIVVGLVTEFRAWSSEHGVGDRPIAPVSRTGRTEPLLGDPGMRLIAASVLLLVCHVAALLGARLVYSDVSLYDRVLAPVHYLAGVAAVGLLASRWSALGPSARATVAGLAIVWGTGSAWATSDVLKTAVTVGLDHANLVERASPTIQWLRRYGADEPIYTNEPAKIYFQLHRDSRSLPWVLDADTIVALGRALRARPGVVVWFAGGTAASYVAADLLPRASTPAKLEGALPLRVWARFDDGVVWVLDERGTPGDRGSPSDTNTGPR